jgi:Cd2+/Zn2+-exporting ATPase
VAKSVRQIPGVLAADVNFATGLLVLEYARDLDPRRQAVGVLVGAGHGIESLDAAEGAQPTTVPSRWVRHRGEVGVAAAGALIVLGWALGTVGEQNASVIAYLAAILVGGQLVLRRAGASIAARTLDMNVLMTIAVCGAAAIGEYGEGATVIFLFALGGLLESRSLARTRRSIRDLMDLAPEQARVIRGGVETLVPPVEVAIGETVLIRPGERIPLDGTIVRGSSAIDEAPITGESVPLDKAEGDPVYAGTLNATGLVEVRVTAAAADTTLARIVHLVEVAQSTRAPVQRLVDRFSRWYTPSVIAGALALGVLVPVLGSLGAPWPGMEAWSDYAYRALVLLVVACPCALVISTPVAIVSAISRATRDGVLVKGGAFLELAGKARALAFDKTGTLTEGKPAVERVVPLAEGFDAGRVRSLAAALEAHSNHPLARAVATSAAASRTGTPPSLAGVVETPGRGVEALVDGEPYAVGSLVFAEERGADGAASEAAEALEADGMTVIALMEGARGGTRVVGLVGMADAVRAEAAATVGALAEAGIERVVMLTGDNERSAARVASATGVTDFRARLLPEGKTAAIRELRDEYGIVAMLGDGINDAPALAAADIGIAMGAAGSDTAIETADVALMRDDLAALPGFFCLGRLTMANIRQNVALSIGVKAVVLVLALFGVASLWMAVFADTGVALIVIANGLRLLRAR